MTAKKSRTKIASAVSLALSSMVLSAGLNAGMINNSNNTLDSLVDTGGSFLGACGQTDTALEACIGAWDLGNVDVEVVNADNIAQIVGTFDPTTGTYTGSGLNGVMTYGDSFRSYVKDVAGTRVARVSGKDWPVGEPTGIKAVVDDRGVINGNPQNCIINTSYEDALDDSVLNDDVTTSYLDSPHPEPVICSSGFQTHKRFKIAMLDTTVATVDPVTKAGKPIDMVFKVTDDASGLRFYQVFSKINNYTGMRLQGYMIQVGTGTGDNFKTASEANIADRLQLSRGIGDYLTGWNPVNTYDTAQDLWRDDQMATFSSGLFGLADKHFPTDGFFDNEPAGFLVGEGCTTRTNLVVNTTTCANSDTLYSTGPLNAATSFYYNYFGDWPHQGLTPRGIFYDTDGDPTTDADLVAYWNGTQWVKPDNLGTFNPSVIDQTPSVFVPVSENELATWAASPRYSVGVIEDVLNLGLNYVIKVGDDIDGDGNSATGTSKITVRIIPIVAIDQNQPAPWTVNLPAVGDLTSSSVPVPVTTSSGGGGCAVGGSGRFDPTLPALLAMGLGFFGWRRFKAGK